VPVVLVHLDVPTLDVDIDDKYTVVGAREWRFSDSPYTAADGTSYDPRITGQITYRRASTSVLWSRRPAQSGLGEIEIVNVDGALDVLLAIPMRNARVSVYWLDSSADAPGTATQIAGGFVDRVESAGEQTLKIITTDILDRLAKPITEATYTAGISPIIGRPKPVAIGRPLSVPLLLVDDIDYYYDAHDTAGELAVLNVRDAGIALGEGSRWQEAPSPRVGIELLQLPVGTIVADLAGDATSTIVWAVDETEGDVAAATWSGSPSAPPGWTVATLDGGALSKITTPVTGAWLRIGSTSGGPDWARLTSVDTMTAGERYTIRVVVDAHAFVGPLRVLETGSPSRLITTITEPGTHVVSWVADGGSLRLEVESQPAQPLPAAVVTLATAYRRQIDALVPHRWDAALLTLCARAGIETADIDTAGLDAAADAWPRGVSFWSAQAPSCRSVADQVADSVLALLHSDHRGRLAARLLEPPAIDATPALEIDDIDVIGEISYAQDRAGNVPRAISAGRNWHVYSADDIADGVSDEERALLTAEYRFRARVGALGPEIDALWRVDTRAGREADRETDVGLPTLLDTAADAEALADRVAALWPVGHVARWIECEVYAPRSALQALRPGSIVRVTSERWSLSQQLTVLVEISGSAGDSAAQLLLWTVRDPSLESVTWARSDIDWTRDDITWSTP
jgi:hypothetical protein